MVLRVLELAGLLYSVAAALLVVAETFALGNAVKMQAPLGIGCFLEEDLHQYTDLDSAPTFSILQASSFTTSLVVRLSQHFTIIMQSR